MESNVGDVLHCEEQLRTTLYCDDKEKLRSRLALLQREYIRTAQRLQRAERSEAVRRHVRSRISQQNHQDQRDPEVISNPCRNTSSLALNSTNRTALGVPQCQGHTGDLAGSENPRRSQVIRFLLPSDAACPQTPDQSHDAARGHRSSPALRLRSRRSRQRWERRSAEAGRSRDATEEVQEQCERMESAKSEGREERVETESTEVVNESEELFSGSESESPSLLLAHWNTCGQTEAGDVEGKETQRRQEQREKETGGKKESLLTCSNPAAHTDGEEGTKNGKRKELEGGEISRGDVRLFQDSSNKDAEQDAAEKIESTKIHNNTVEIKEEKSEMVRGEHEVKGAGLLDSCTLVEGLLFPVEYYVRTTRRMTFSQSQPDMQAVILSQLSAGRPRRSRGRGRGRGSNRHTHSSECSDPHSQTALTTASPSACPRVESQAADTPPEPNNQSSSDISDQLSSCRIDTDACFSPAVTAAHPARGRRRGRRGRGRGRRQTPRCSPSLDAHQLGHGQTSDSLKPSSSPSLLTPVEAVPVPNESQPASTHSTATQAFSGGDAAQSSSASTHQEKVYPIFLNSSGRTNRSSQRSRSTASWRSLLLPSSPLAQTSQPPLPSLFPSLLLNNLTNFDIPQDFHLPDDQFASLKLHKLRRVAVESGVEHFASPSHNTRRSIRCPDARFSGDPVMPLPLPLSLTPMITSSPRPTEAKQAASQSIDLQNMSMQHTDTSTSQSITKESSDTKNPGEQQTERCHIGSTQSVSVVHDCAADSVDQYKEKDAVNLDTHSQSSVSATSTHRSTDHTVKPQHHSSEPQIKESSVISSEEQTACPGVAHPLEDQSSTNHQTEHEAVIGTLSCDSPEESRNCTVRNEDKAAEGSPVQHLNVKSSAKDSKESPNTPRDGLVEKSLALRGVQSQLLFSPLASAPCPLITPRLPSSAVASSPTLPSLGLTPHPIPVALPLTSSPSAPALTLPPPHSPSNQALSPPVLSPCPSLTSLPPSQPPASPVSHIQASLEPFQKVEPVPCPHVSGVQLQGSGGQVGPRPEETAEEHMMRCTHTLKAPAGGCLVDACCLPGPSRGLCVAAAGKWAVCLWSQTAACDWSLTHTWAFNEPVISVFPVPDAAGLMCVTLGQLEIREVRMLSCSSLSQVLLCEGLIQAVVGVSKSRVVTSSHSASGSTLHVLTLSDSGSTSSSQPLVSPGVCVGALAPVDGLSDALIGTDEGGRLFIWNLKSGQLLQRISLADGLCHTACLRGYSYCGVLFVLLQHQLLSSLEEEERAAAEEQMFLEEEQEEERKKTALFSLVAVNPLSGKSVLATRLYPPKAWSGRLCEADVSGSSVVGLSQTGCACVWELGRRGTSRMVWAPESEGWQLARWGEGGTLMTGCHNGDVSLHSKH